MDEPSKTADEVVQQIRELCMKDGAFLTKREVKKLYPDIMRTAMYYYPSWDHAVKYAAETATTDPSESGGWMATQS